MSYYVEEISPIVQLECYDDKVSEDGKYIKCIVDGEYEDTLQLLVDGISKYAQQASLMYSIDPDRIIYDIRTML